MRNVKKMVYDYKERFGVQGRKCIVTGGAQGLSRGMVERFLENGAEVVLIGPQEEKLEQVVEEYYGKGCKTHGVAGDPSKEAELGRILDEAMELLGGKLDVVVPVADIQRRYESWEPPEKMWNPVISVDLNHVWFMCQQATQIMRDKDTVGKIVNIGSINSSFGETTVSAYSAAEGAMTQLSRGIASDCADHSICRNVIVPGCMDTEMCINVSQERKNKHTKRITTGR